MYNNTLYDQHIHSTLSYDSVQENTIPNIIDTAAGLGLAGIAVTDHFDPLWPDEDDLSYLDIAAYERALTEAEQLINGRIRFAKGIELGFIPGEALEICEKTLSSYPYDFVIGSVHYSQAAPIEHPLFLEGRSLKDIVEEYYTLILDSIKDFTNYDVLGHINCIDRYTEGLPAPDLFMPYVEEIMRVAISDGKGIEINTSAFRYGLADRGTPTQPILDLYKELGGEIVTIGSDAHQPEHIGTFIKEGEEMLLASGIRYLTVFSERRPEFIRL